MRQLFMAVLSLSLSGTLIGLMIAVTHPITGKYFSKRWNYYIWLLVVVRLILPLHIFPALSGGLRWQISLEKTGAGISAQDASGRTLPSVPDAGTDMTNIPYDTTEAHNRNNPLTATPTETTLYADNAADTKPETTSADDMPNTGFMNTAFPNTVFSAGTILSIAAYIWFFGAITACFVRLLHYRLFRSRIKKHCVRISDNRITAMENTFCAGLQIENPPALYESTAVSGPMTIGLRNPMIVIPKPFSDADEHMGQELNLTRFQLVLHHELIHVARKDLLYKWIYQLLLCVHWFNPVLYRIGRQINRDCELSCDEAILTKLTDSGKRLYGNILLDTAAQGIDFRRSAFSTTLLNDKRDLKKRLDSILHYKKTTRYRMTLSVCTLIVMLTVSACSMIWISPSDASASESVHSSSDDVSPFAKVLTSIYSADDFVDNFAKPDHSSDAWKVYDDDELLAGDDIQDNRGAYNYSGGNNKISASGFVLYGSDTFLIAYAEKDVDVTIQTAFDLSEGNFKIVYIAPDNTALTLNDTGAAATQTITMQKGRNVLKMVGQGAKLTHLKIDYTNLKSQNFEKIYHSEEEEYIVQVKNAVIAGEPLNKDKIIDALYYMDEKDASDAFGALLTAGTQFTDEELCDFFLYSDTALSSQYLSEAVKAGTIDPPGEDAIEELMPYLTGDCAAELLMSLPTEDFYDIFEDNICYLNHDQIHKCLMDYIGRGGVLTYSMYSDIYPYLGQDTIRELDKIS